MSDPAKSEGVFNTIGRIGDTLLATAQNRVELLANDMHEEKRRLVEMILWSAALSAFAMMALTLITFMIVAAFWEGGRTIALGVLSALYSVGAIWAWISLRRRLAQRTALSDTLGELEKDRECLRRNLP
ncbi:MAG TPA: phage holin family protein [Candidatus Limnocylindria bacterium]|jgi:uncharacterized membrane protein YqjE|nr:phage holin family protein [Candidatus Limnocylindria bacterium]